MIRPSPCMSKLASKPGVSTGSTVSGAQLEEFRGVRVAISVGVSEEGVECNVRIGFRMTTKCISHAIGLHGQRVVAIGQTAFFKQGSGKRDGEIERESLWIRRGWCDFDLD